MSEAVARVEPLIDLERSGALTRTGLVLPNTITMDQAEALGRLLGEFHQVIQWAIGDYLNQIEDIFGEESAQLGESLGLSEDARDGHQWVAKKIPMPKRRAELSFSHHRIVASMKDIGRRDELLEQAVQNRWTTRELHAHKVDAPIGELPEPPLDFRYRLLRTAATKVWGTKDMMADGAMFAVPAIIMEELGSALEVGGLTQ